VSNKRKVGGVPPVRQTQVQSPWPKRLALLAGAGLVLGLVAVVFMSQPGTRGVPDGTQIITVGDPVHVEGQVYAAGEVPAGGAHNAIPQNCGYYDQPVATENVVHSLEHGAVWISYDPSLGDVLAQSLRRYVSRTDKVLVSPVAGQPSPIIATAWGRQLSVDDPDDPRISQFANEFVSAASAPEPRGGCSGGIGQPQF